MNEHCPGCDADTEHDVSLEIRTESQREENAQFSREPYRVATCKTCDTESVTRMNSETPA